VFNVDCKIFVVDNECPHLGEALGSSRLEGKLVTCPNHGWQFDVTDGKCITVD